MKETQLDGLVLRRRDTVVYPALPGSRDMGTWAASPGLWDMPSKPWSSQNVLGSPQRRQQALGYPGFTRGTLCDDPS